MHKPSGSFLAAARVFALLLPALAGAAPGLAQQVGQAATARAAASAPSSSAAPPAATSPASASPPAGTPAPERPRHVVDCPGQPVVTVSAADPADAETACQGARAAIDFLARAGLPAPVRSRLDIVALLPGELRDRAVGCYLPDEQRMLLLTYAAFERLGEWLRVPVDRALYRSAATHEMAHAIVGCQAADSPLPVPAHEYVAYVTLFATMDPALRARVLARYPGTGFANVLQVNAIVYLVDPLQFGVDAWRHYLKRRDRDHWLRDIVLERVIPEFPTGESP